MCWRIVFFEEPNEPFEGITFSTFTLNHIHDHTVLAAIAINSRESGSTDTDAKCPHKVSPEISGLAHGLIRVC